jgi:hypothetical protein
MFGYKVVREDYLKMLEESHKKHLAFVHYAYWFSGWDDVYKLLCQFGRGEIDHCNVGNIREEFAESMGTTVYGEPLKDDRTIKSYGTVKTVHGARVEKESCDG